MSSLRTAGYRVVPVTLTAAHRAALLDRGLHSDEAVETWIHRMLTAPVPAPRPRTFCREAVVEAVARLTGELALGDIEDEAGISRRAAQRHASELVALGVLIRKSTGRYTVHRAGLDHYQRHGEPLPEGRYPHVALPDQVHCACGARSEMYLPTWGDACPDAMRAEIARLRARVDEISRDTGARPVRVAS